jgi:hypothetical protein
MTKDYRMVDRTPGQALMTVRASAIERIVCFDPDPDLSYLDPDADPDYAAENAERLAAESDPPDGVQRAIKLPVRR